jgi:hypothetical protein
MKSALAENSDGIAISGGISSGLGGPKMILLPLVVLSACACVIAIKLSDIAKDIHKMAEDLAIVKSNLFFDLEKRYPELADNREEDAKSI